MSKSVDIVRLGGSQEVVAIFGKVRNEASTFNLVTGRHRLCQSYQLAVCRLIPKFRNKTIEPSNYIIQLVETCALLL